MALEQREIHRLASDKKGLQSVVISLSQWIEFVIVALSTGHRQAEYSFAKCVDDVDQNGVTLEQLVFFVAADASPCQEPCCDELFV